MENELYACKKWDISEFLHSMKSSNKLLETYETEILVERFEKEFQEDGDEYLFTEDEIINFLNTMTDEILSETLRSLTDKGLVDVNWDSEADDFTFKLSQQGEKVADYLAKQKK